MWGVKGISKKSSASTRRMGQHKPSKSGQISTYKRANHLRKVTSRILETTSQKLFWQVYRGRTVMQPLEICPSLVGRDKRTKFICGVFVCTVGILELFQDLLCGHYWSWYYTLKLSSGCTTWHPQQIMEDRCLERLILYLTSCLALIKSRLYFLLIWDETGKFR